MKSQNAARSFARPLRWMLAKVLIGLQDCQPWLHVNAVGADLAGKTELPAEFLKRSFVCPDFACQAMVEGECQQLDDEVTVSICDVARAPERFLTEVAGTTVFGSTGFALEDWVVMELAVEKSRELGLGTLIPIESLSGDPQDPYGFLSRNLQRSGSMRPVVKTVIGSDS